MEQFFSLLPPAIWIAACAIAFVAGIVKGAVGFAMPSIIISALSTIVDPKLALAGLILPTLATNGMQALAQGPSAALSSVRRFRVYLVVGGVIMVASAQLVPALSIAAMLGCIGILVVLFVLLQLSKWQFALSQQRRDVEASVGAVAGFMGGLTGMWGPPTVLYLTALSTEKAEQMRIQGVVYGLGALALVGAHVSSGILSAETLPLSLALVAPALFGQWIGGKVLERIDQAMFKRATLVVLLIVGLNLIRRALLT